MKFAEFV